MTLKATKKCTDKQQYPTSFNATMPILKKNKKNCSDLSNMNW